MKQPGAMKSFKFHVGRRPRGTRLDHDRVERPTRALIGRGGSSASRSRGASPTRRTRWEQVLMSLATALARGPSNEGVSSWSARPISFAASGPPSKMTKTVRLFLVTAAVATVALGGAARAFACGNSSGYSYAGIGAPTRGFGISALITPLDAFDILNGHVAGWVGVGGPGQGPNGTNEWIQIGYSGFPWVTGSDIYYEVAQPGRYPTYHQVPPACRSGARQGDRARDAQPAQLVARVAQPQAGVAADPPAGKPRSLEPDRDCRELGRRDRRRLQHLPLSLPPRLDRPHAGRGLAPAHRRLSDPERRRPAFSGPAVPQASSRRKAGRPSSSSPLLLDPDRRAERRERPEAPGRRVRDADAAVRDGLAEQLRRLVPWMPTTPPPGHSVSFE